MLASKQESDGSAQIEKTVERRRSFHGKDKAKRGRLVQSILWVPMDHTWSARAADGVFWAITPTRAWGV
jgi:hypothetical protein